MCKHQPKLWAMRRTRTRSWAYSRWSLYAYVVFVESMHFISPATGRNCVLVKMPPDGLISHSCVSMSTSYSHVARLETERCCRLNLWRRDEEIRGSSFGSQAPQRPERVGLRRDSLRASRFYSPHT